MRILYTRPSDGGLSVVHAAHKSDIEKVLGPLTEEQFKAHVWEKSIPKDALTAVEIDDSYQLPDREFRNAWMQDGKEVTFDLEKARAIQLDRIRQVREPRLIDLDKEFMIGLEKGAPSEEIVARKQALRDITEPLKKAVLTSIDDVKKAFPDELK